MTERMSTTSHDGAASPPFSLRQSGHDLRNVLNVIRSASYLLRRKLATGGGEHVELVEMIEDSVKSAEGIAAEMMEEATRLGETPTSRGGPSN